MKTNNESTYVEVSCGVCGTKIKKLRSRIRWELKRNPNYVPVCSNKCKGEHSLKKAETCSVLKLHKYTVQEDPERFTTERIVEIMCESKPRINAYIGTTKVTRTNNTSSGHKGDVSRHEWIRRNCLVRAGKASWWSALWSLDKAIAVAGI
jgi:hypothetical protein